MKKTKIIDAHAHIFPAKIADKAAASIGSFYDLPMSSGGSCEMLIKSGNEIGVSRYLVCSTATKPEQVESINDFIAAAVRQYPDKFIGFGTLHPGYPDIEAEIERIEALGLHGVKLHPDFQRFDIDDERMLPVYEKLAGRLPVLFHTGDARYEYSAPKKLAAVAKTLPALQCIAAHFGGYQRWEEAAGCLKLPNVYIDTSSSLFVLERDFAVQLLRHFGTDKAFFGTDFPMWKHADEYARFQALELTAQENENILYNNFCAFLNIHN